MHFRDRKWIIKSKPTNSKGTTRETLDKRGLRCGSEQGKIAFGRELPLRPFSEDFWTSVQPIWAGF
jgi:hypothetical protein